MTNEDRLLRTLLELPKGTRLVDSAFEDLLEREINIPQSVSKLLTGSAASAWTSRDE